MLPKKVPKILKNKYPKMAFLKPFLNLGKGFFYKLISINKPTTGKMKILSLILAHE